MKRLFLALLISSSCALAPHTYGDLPQVFCQDKYADSFEQRSCSEMLVGIIDAIMVYGDYCPDGNTSYGYIIETWQRLLANKPALKELPTTTTVKIAIASLGLDCSG